MSGHGQAEARLSKHDVLIILTRADNNVWRNQEPWSWQFS